MEQEKEIFFICPYCWQRISMLLETAYGKQSYTEECEVCCQPIDIEYEVREVQVEGVTA